mgnify:CR=1 FL=1
MGYLFRKVGAGGPSPNKIVLLRDADGDGKAEQRFVLRGELGQRLVDLGIGLLSAVVGGIAWVASRYASRPSAISMAVARPPGSSVRKRNRLRPDPVICYPATR